MMLTYFSMVVREIERRWHCRGLHGSDQAVHNYLVYTGKLIGTGESLLGWIISVGVVGVFADRQGTGCWLVK
jgi:hypothetical protein